MTQPRSTDPWSTFLDPAGPARVPRRLNGPHQTHETPDRGTTDGDLSDASRRLLALLVGERVLLLDEVGDRLGLGLLDVAEAVESLRAQGLVAVVERDGAERIELTESRRGR